ncbi:MAG: Gfo/Idh/MocA family oxidoreductase, partial [Mycetocola sp.]
TLSASKINSLDARELVIHARGGSYEVRSGDVQTSSLLNGIRPSTAPATWGFDSEDNWGTAYTPTRSWTVPSEQGSYARFYEELGASVRRGTGSPVPIAEALHTLEVLDAARTSATEGITVTLS